MNESGPYTPLMRLRRRTSAGFISVAWWTSAVFSGLLEPDPNSEIGHFAFSRHYTLGRDLDRSLQGTLREFKSRHPDMVAMRRSKQNDC